MLIQAMACPLKEGLIFKQQVGTVLLIALFFLLPVHAAAETPSDQKAIRGEFNLSGGWVLKEKVGIVVSYWWYPVPNIIALGCSLDYLGPTLPFSLDVGLSLPMKRVVPFVCAGVGGSLTRGGINFFGGGIKFRMWPKMGFIVEYRFYNYHKQVLATEGDEVFQKVLVDRRSGYIGIGIALRD